MIYKAVASSGRLSDGEEAYLPILPRRVLVTESLPLPVRGPTTKHIEFPQLLGAGASKSIEHRTLTVQMTSHPAWYAVMSLPYLMEYPWECSEQTFNRFYAMPGAGTSSNQTPRFVACFSSGKATPAPDSPLEKNQPLKSLLLEETPWVRQAERKPIAAKPWLALR